MKQTSVTQEHGSGCAVACVAFLLKKSYTEALSLFTRPYQAWGRGFFCREIVDALQRAGKNYSYCYLNSRKEYLLKEPNCIVFINRSKKFPIGHFLAKADGKSWMNPWSNYPIIASAKSSFQKRLPGKPIYIIYPNSIER